MSKKHHKIRVGISIGDINGIGPEVVLKALGDSRILESFTPVVYASQRVLNFYKKQLGLNDIQFNTITDAAQAQSKKLNVVEAWNDEVYVEPGVTNSDGGKYAFASLEAAVSDIAANKLDVLVTAPLNKNTVQQQHKNFRGHTEFLAEYANEENPLMILMSSQLKVALVTGHIALSDVPKALSPELIVSKAKTLHKSLVQDFRISKPKIAVLALNPHAGDKGLMGNEEESIIIPAIKQLKTENILAMGPFPADGFFGSSSWSKFDAILAMYHDQGLAPFKSIAFEDGVNYTAGLPIVRTSPAHGTAYDIAGKNQASEMSFRQAIYDAIEIYLCRQEHKELTSNVLATTKLDKDN